jgi:hypothetical protein
MMRKSRLMKAMAGHIPMVYICARAPGWTGYPPRTPAVMDWFDVGIVSLFNPPLDRSTILSDKFYILSTLKYSAFLLAAFQGLSDLLRNETLVQEFRIRQFVAVQQYTWMWDYFAETYNISALREFWQNVLMDARRTINDFTSPKVAVSFFESDYKNLLQQKYDTLVKSFEAIGYQREMTLVLVCDESSLPL